MPPLRSTLALASLAALHGCAAAPPEDARTRLFDGMGPLRRPITTRSEIAQHYFDQGLTWAYAFAYGEAIRSFARAAELDPDCAMAWWGIALCQGPRCEEQPGMTDARSAAAFAALQQALAHRERANDVERALIDALAQRYARPWPADRGGLDRAYAAAMAAVHERFPDDSDVGALLAEAMLLCRPSGPDAGGAPPADPAPHLAVLERVLARDPHHPGAAHLYVLALAGGPAPARGLDAAASLCDLVPASGQLLHAPALLFARTGRFGAAIAQEQKALAADAAYRQLAADPWPEIPHMVQHARLLAFAAMMAGRERLALCAARRPWTDLPPERLRERAPACDRWLGTVYEVQRQFGRWDALLAEPAPPDWLPVTTAVWRAHRALAFAARREFAAAEQEYARFGAARAAAARGGGGDAARLLQVDGDLAAGLLALQRGDLDHAAQFLARAAAVEDTLGAGAWLPPARQLLGAAHLARRDFPAAERVFRADLDCWPENGWALFGLFRALREQGRMSEAVGVMGRLEQAWARADRPIAEAALPVARR